jgi:putative membrane protein
VLLIANALVLIVAVLHVWFLILEAVLWRKPMGLRTFGLTPEQAATTATLAANQGIYNGFLAAGLVTGILLGPPTGFAFKLFFLACVIVAGLFGAATVSKRILLIQALPAVVALGAVLLAGA